MSPVNLWADLGKVEKVRTPRLILIEQAGLLTQATGGALAASSGPLPQALGQFRYVLDVAVPALNGYSVRVVTIMHRIELYPVRVWADKPNTDVSCENEKAFLETLRSILSSADVKELLSRLLSQVT